MGRVAPRGWAVLGRDTKILERPSELQAYRKSGLHMFLFPGEATVAELVELLSFNLREICTVTTQRRPQVLRATKNGLFVVARGRAHRP